MFATTRWSLIATATDPTAPQAREALTDLCQLYWYPVYAYVRRRGRDHHAAEDLTQAFFTRLLESNDLATADRTRGRFRSFLLVACQHFLANCQDHDRAQKRGGGWHRFSIDCSEGSTRAGLEPVDPHAAERHFEREWALALLERALNDLKTEYAQSGRTELFDRLKPCLTGEMGGYAELADGLGLTVGAVKVAIHRLRQRYRDRLRAVIAETVASPEEIDNEVRDLFAALGD